MKIIGIVSLCTSGATSFLSQLMTFDARTPEVLLHQLPLQRYLSAIESNDLELLEELIISSLTRLKAGGAEMAVCPNNTAHIVMGRVTAQSPLPVILLPDVVARRCCEMELSSPLLLGTSPLVDSGVYQEALAAYGIAAVTLSGEDNQILSSEIIKATKSGDPKFAFSDYIKQAIQNASSHCDAILLACSELVSRYHMQLEKPTIDPVALLAQEAAQDALAQTI
jgi:amino-acid racemase